jgi:hypothetical protein
MTFDEVVGKRNAEREMRLELKNEFRDVFENASESILFEKLQNTEYNWGHWDGIITVMKQLNLKEIRI